MVGNLQVHLLLFTDDVVLLVSLVPDFQACFGTLQLKVSEMKISITSLRPRKGEAQSSIAWGRAATPLFFLSYLVRMPPECLPLETFQA